MKTMLKNAKMRVPIPRNAEEVLLLAEKVYNKHLQLGKESPLNAMEDYSWATDGPKIAEAMAFHKKAEDLKKLMENAYKERDLLVNSIDPTTKASRDVLTGIYRKNMKRMGDWGFTVDDTPKATAASKAKKAIKQD
jgi:hypothetical protein